MSTAPPMGDVRMPPHNDEAERSVLGSVFIDNDVIDLIDLRPEQFFRQNHRHAWRVMLKLRERASVIDVLTVADQLAAEHLLEHVGGADWLARLSRDVPSSANAEQYAGIVRGKAALRDVIATAQAIADEAHHTGDVDGFLERAEERLLTVTKGATQTVAYSSMPEVIRETIEGIQECASGNALLGWPTPWPDLNELIGEDRERGGLRPESMYVIAARPGMGKTAFALNLAQGLMAQGVGVGMLSLEMSKRKLGLRMLASSARVSTAKMRTGRMNQAEWARVIEQAGQMVELPMYTCDRDQLELTHVKRLVRLLVEVEGCKVIIVDYLQRIRVSSASDPRQAVTDASRALAALAKELDVAVVCLAQLNRDCEKRADKRPTNTDLKESGAIEEDADVIMMLYRHEVYEPEDSDARGQAEVIVTKSRDGSPGTVHLKFTGEYTRFDSLERWH